MIPVSSLVRTEFRSGPTQLLRFNGFASAFFTGTPKPDRSSGEVMAEIDQLIADQFESQGVGIAYSGQSLPGARRQRAGRPRVRPRPRCIVFLVLAAQYESWSIPFAVLLGVPFGALGAFLGIWLRGIAERHLLPGRVDHRGRTRREERHPDRGVRQRDPHAAGTPLIEAATEAARERFRPILMTSFAFILGVSPLVIASGAGAGSRHSLGTGVFAGMLFATTIGIFFIPLFFRVIRGLAERGGSRQARGRVSQCPRRPHRRPDDVTAARQC